MMGHDEDMKRCLVSVFLHMPDHYSIFLDRIHMLVMEDVIHETLMENSVRVVTRR
jgi:hypothetical protein